MILGSHDFGKLLVLIISHHEPALATANHYEKPLWKPPQNAHLALEKQPDGEAIHSMARRAGLRGNEAETGECSDII